MPDVLVVDDDEIVRGMVAFLFEGEGYEVRQAKDGVEAVSYTHLTLPTICSV